MWFEILLKRHIVPDLVVRFFIWVHFVIRRLKEPRNIEMRQDKLQKFIKDLKQSPIALETDIPNDQHYEVPSEFFKYIMGEHMKYSCCLFNEGRRGKRNWAKHLDKAEEKMLALTVKRAGIKDGMDILDCGCGWGSLALYAAEKFPNSKIVAISNSSTQKDYIIKIAGEKNLKNIEVITCDIKHFEIERKFDVITSIEMFEHMRNYEK